MHTRQVQMEANSSYILEWDRFRKLYDVPGCSESCFVGDRARPTCYCKHRGTVSCRQLLQESPSREPSRLPSSHESLFPVMLYSNYHHERSWSNRRRGTFILAPITNRIIFIQQGNKLSSSWCNTKQLVVRLFIA